MAFPCDPDRLRIVEECHEPEIQLHMPVTVEERQPRIVSYKVKFEFPESAQHRRPQLLVLQTRVAVR